MAKEVAVPATYPLIRSSLLSGFPALVADLGGPLEEILEEAGLSLEQIEQPTLLIPFEKQIRLVQLATRSCGVEQFGLELAKRQDMAVFGALTVLIMNCNSVLQGMKLFGRYLHYSVQAVKLEMREQNGLVYFIVDTQYPAAAASDQFWDHSLALSYNLIRMLGGPDWAPRSVYLSRPEPDEPGNYSRYFRSPVAFGSEFSGLVFEAKVLQQPISSAVSSVPHQLQEYLRKNFEGNFLEQMRQLINSLLPTRNCTAKAVADCLGYSLRTLQRKLQAEQTSFQAQIDQVRRELAISCLQEPRYRLTDIAELLGFAELSIFSRSFKRWFGVTPSQWRARRFG
jgi:AraC-like DNA-binding protein